MSIVLVCVQEERSSSETRGGTSWKEFLSEFELGLRPTGEDIGLTRLCMTLILSFQ